MTKYLRHIRTEVTLSIATALVTEAVFLLDELKKMTVADLRNACVERGVTHSGNKPDLISNITSHQDELVHSKKRKTDGGTETPSKKPQNSNKQTRFGTLFTGEGVDLFLVEHLNTILVEIVGPSRFNDCTSFWPLTGAALEACWAVWIEMSLLPQKDVCEHWSTGIRGNPTIKKMLSRDCWFAVLKSLRQIPDDVMFAIMGCLQHNFTHGWLPHPDISNDEKEIPLDVQMYNSMKGTVDHFNEALGDGDSRHRHHTHRRAQMISLLKITQFNAWSAYCHATGSKNSEREFLKMLSDEIQRRWFITETKRGKDNRRARNARYREELKFKKSQVTSDDEWEQNKEVRQAERWAAHIRKSAHLKSSTRELPPGKLMQIWMWVHLRIVQNSPLRMTWMMRTQPNTYDDILERSCQT
ncbi:hypothetical protein PROFUN_10292 [Planoprotostelium fungivorum]|uniref:SAP domain-containing protein n=1 Tax=Planoprotostelium fungivorum TaxID=1890364 RepID=A0A2P6MRR5_9EUKA|nr:hypothetical protein PROFUN_10292 [Planoprotostelium fungivorum]